MKIKLQSFIHSILRMESSQIDGVPARSLLCKHYACPKPNHFETSMQTLEVRVLNRSKNIIAAANGLPLYDRKKMSFATQTTSLDGLEQFKQQYQQTSRDGFTQPYNPILYGSEHVKGEYQMTGRSSRYETSEVFLERRMKAIILIQSKIRQYNAIQKTEQLRQQFRLKLERQQEEAEIAAQKLEEEHQFQLQRRIQPKTSEDFKLLYEEVATWVRQQKFAIDQANLPLEARQAALELLVEKQARLIANIDQLKRVAQMLNKSDKISQFFKKTSEPRKWQLADGSYVYVDTPFTVRAATLRNIYYQLEDAKLAKELDRRLDLLLQTKYICKEFDCELTREIIRLIDEEADLLSRGRPNDSLDGLRRRIQSLFLQYCENPEFNPAVLTVMDRDKLIYRPNTLPIIDKMSTIKREAIGRLKNNELKKGVYGQMDMFRRQFGILGLSGLIRGGTDKLRHANVLNKSQLAILPEIPVETMSLDEESQASGTGPACLIVDMERFNQDGVAYQIVTKVDDEIQTIFDIVDGSGKTWLTVQCNKVLSSAASSRVSSKASGRGRIGGSVSELRVKETSLGGLMDVQGEELDEAPQVQLHGQ